MHTDFSSETKHAGKQKQHLQGAERKSCQPRILYPEKISFKNKHKMKTFSKKQNLREFTNSRPALQGTLKTILESEGK